MKKAIFAAVVLLCAATLTLVAGRGNVVVHLDKDGNREEMLSSAGNCRHHLRSHPGDSVKMAGGESNNPDDCN